MTLRGFVVVLALMVPSAAMADPITVSGMWSPTMTPPSADPTVLPLEATAFWSNPSWDGPLMGVAYLIDAFNTENLEYLHNPDGSPASFRFDEADRQSDVALWDHADGLAASSGETNPAHSRMTAEPAPSRTPGTTANSIALFRIRGPETTRYFLGIEDILLSERTTTATTTTTS